MRREEKLAKNTLILSIGTFLPKLAALITLPILTGYLTKTEYGTYDLITVLVSLVLPAATLQIQTAAFRFLIDERDKKEDVRIIVSSIFAFIIPVSFFALIILFICLPVGSLSGKVLICAYYLSDIVVNATRQVARGLDQNIEYSISAVVSAIGKLVFAIIFVCWLKMGLNGAILSLLLASFISFVVLLYRSGIYSCIKINAIRINKIQEMLQYSWPMVPNSMSMWVVRLSDRFVVTFFMGLPANAIYAVANKIPSLLTLAQSTFTMAWQENASIVSKDDDSTLYYSTMFRTMFDLTAGLLGLIICVSPFLFSLLIRGDYHDAYSQMPILFASMFFFSMASFLGGIYVAYKKTQSVGITTVVAAAINLVVDVLLIKKIGLYAASGSTLISFMFLCLYRMFDIRKIVKLKYDYFHVFFVCFLLAFECLLCYKHITWINWVNVLICTISFFFLNKTIIKYVWNRFQKK